MARFEIWGRKTEEHQPGRKSMKSGIERCGLLDTGRDTWPETKSKLEDAGWELKEKVVSDDLEEAQVIYNQYLKGIGEGWQHPS